MARKKTSLETTARRTPALRAAAAELAGTSTSARQLVARRDVQRSAPIAGKAATTALRQPVAGPSHDDAARRDALESALLQFVSPHTRVLVIGRDTSPLSRSFSSAGCRVSVVETRQDAPAGSVTFSDRVIVGDPETLDLAAALDGVQFDSIVVVQLLEHVRHPVRMLTTLRKHLTADGAVVAAVPNIMHGRIRLGFLTGKSPAELLAPDTTSPPSHWYDAAALQRTFERAGLVITRLERLTEAFDPRRRSARGDGAAAVRRRAVAGSPTRRRGRSSSWRTCSRSPAGCASRRAYGISQSRTSARRSR